MATYSETKVVDALFARLSALSFSPALPIAWPNKAFTPPTDRKWLQVNDIPAATTPFSLSGGTSEYVGLMQVDVFRPLDEGHKPARETAGKITDHFRPPLLLSSEGLKVKITQASAGPAMQDGAAIKIPVTIRYRCFF